MNISVVLKENDSCSSNPGWWKNDWLNKLLLNVPLPLWYNQLPPVPEPDTYNDVLLTCISWLLDIHEVPVVPSKDQLAWGIAHLTPSCTTGSEDKNPVPLFHVCAKILASIVYSAGKFFAWLVYNCNMNLQDDKLIEYFVNAALISDISNFTIDLDFFKVSPSLSNCFPISNISSNPVFESDLCSYKVASLSA